jgi:hypothetical protein
VAYHERKEGSGEVEIDLSGRKSADEYANTPVEPEVEAKSEPDELDIEIVDDTPEADRNRKPSKPPADVTDEELEGYSEKVRNRIKHISKGYLKATTTSAEPKKPLSEKDKS